MLPTHIKIGQLNTMLHTHTHKKTQVEYIKTQPNQQATQRSRQSRAEYNT